MAISLPPFDRDRDFVALREFTCRGKKLRKGNTFDKFGVSIRLLRILYEARAIGYPAARPIEGPAMPGGLPVLPWHADTKRSIDETHNKAQLQGILSGLGLTIDRRWGKTALIDEIERAAHGLVAG